MNSIEDVAKFISGRILEMYEKPFNYAEDANGLCAVLFEVHLIWATTVGRYEEFRDCFSQICEKYELQAMSFTTKYLIDNPQASRGDQMRNLVERWQEVSSLLNIA